MYWLVIPVAIAITRHAPPAGGRRSCESRRRVRAGDDSDERRPPISRRGTCPSRNGAAVISYPTRQGRLEQARMLVRHGYGVLLRRRARLRRKRGRPEPVRLGRGQGHRRCGRLAAGRPDVNEGRIGGIGFSVGGEMMLQAAASNTGLRAVVSEGAGVRSVREHLLRGPRGWFSLPEAAVQTVAVAVLSGTGRHPRSPDLVPQHLPASALPRLRRPRGRRRGAEPRLLRRRLHPEDTVEDRGSGSRGWLPRRARGNTSSA